MFFNAAVVRAAWGWAPDAGLWWGIQPVSAGVFGVPAACLVMLALSLWPAARARKVGKGPESGL